MIPLGALREQVGVIGQNAEDSQSHDDHGNSEKHPRAPPIQCACLNKE
jgi:hypothetical protein